MQELIELRTFIEQYGKDVNGASEVYSKCNYPMESVHFYGRYVASLEIIKQLDLILNNSVVKPSERRSPTDETFSGCKPPDERQNPQEDFLACDCDVNTVCDNCQKINHSNA